MERTLLHDDEMDSIRTENQKLEREKNEIPKVWMMKNMAVALEQVDGITDTHFYTDSLEPGTPKKSVLFSKSK